MQQEGPVSGLADAFPVDLDPGTLRDDREQRVFPENSVYLDLAVNDPLPRYGTGSNSKF